MDLEKIKQSIEKGLRGGTAIVINEILGKDLKDGKTLEEIYDTQMRELSEEQEGIVSSYKNGEKIDGKIFYLKSEIEACEKYFVLNMDDRLRDAKIFLDNVDSFDKVKRNEFWNEVCEKGLDEVLSKENKNKVGSRDNPGLFQLYNRFSQKIAAEQQKGQFSLQFIEKNIHEDLKEAVSGFDLRCLGEPFSYTEDEKKFNHLVNDPYYYLTKDIVHSSTDGLAGTVSELKLAGDKACPISKILQEKGNKGSTGMDFMLECHPEILTDLALYKLLGDMDVALRECMINKNDLTLLKSKNSTDLAALKKALSCIPSKISTFMPEIQQEFEKFKEKKGRIQKENLQVEKRKEKAGNIIEKYLKHDNNIAPIVERLRRYADTDKRHKSESLIISEAGEVLKSTYRDPVSMKEFQDLSYLVFSSAGGFNGGALHDHGKRAQLSGIEFIYQNYPELLDQCTILVLCQQLEETVKKIQDKDKTQNIEDGLQAMKDLVKDINIEECKISLKNVRAEYDQELKAFAELNPEYYVNYDQWNDWVVDAKKGGNSFVTEEELRLHDTNDVSKFASLIAKHTDDIYLKNCLDYRKENIELIEKTAKNGPDQKILDSKAFVKMSDSTYYLEGISHQQIRNEQDSWSVVLSEMLDFKGIQLKPTTIRCYRATPSDSSYGTYVESYLQNKGKCVNIGSRMNLIAKLLPEATLHRIVIQPQETKGNKIEDQLTELMENVLKDNAPVGIGYGGHYLLIAGREGEKVRIYDPMKSNYMLETVGELVSKIYTSREKEAELFWFSDISREYEYIRNRIKDPELSSHDLNIDPEYKHENYKACYTDGDGWRKEIVYGNSEINRK